eukprot:1162066-Pelagomonas_calceolata.AAC.12
MSYAKPIIWHLHSCATGVINQVRGMGAQKRQRCSDCGSAHVDRRGCPCLTSGKTLAATYFLKQCNLTLGHEGEEHRTNCQFQTGAFALTHLGRAQKGSHPLS